MAHRRRKKNIIPLNVVRKRGEKHRVSKEFVNITVYSTSPQSQHVSSVPANLESGEGCTQELIPGYLTDQPEDQITLSHEADSYQSQHSKRKLKQNEKWRESSCSAFKALINARRACARGLQYLLCLCVCSKFAAFKWSLYNKWNY